MRTPGARRRRFGRAAPFVIVALVGAVASACFGGGSKSSPRSGGVLKLAIVGVTGLDPALAREPTEVLLAEQLFDPLTTYDPATLAVKPALATAWEASADQTQFTFHLATDRTFSDGARVTATDVKFTLDRIATRALGSPLASQLEEVQGFKAAQDGSAPGLAGVTTPDPATVVVALDHPLATLPSVLGHPGFGVVPQHVLTSPSGSQFAARPIGTGPFRYLERKGAIVRLARFRGHKPAPARVDELQLVTYKTVGGAYAALRNGDVDIAPIPPEKIADARSHYGTAGLRPYAGVLFYGMNVRSPKLSDTRFRQAIVDAVNRRHIVDTVYNGTELPTTALVAGGMPDGAKPGCPAPCGFDRKTAKELVTQVFPIAGSVPTIEIDYDTDSLRVQERIAGLVKGDLDAVGIPSELRAHPPTDYGRFLVSGQQELFRLGWIADYPSVDAFLFPQFVSNRQDNLTGLADGDVDFALRSARAEPDPAKRAALYSDAEKRIGSLAVVVPVLQFETRLAASKHVHDLVVTALNTFDGSRVWLSR